MTVKDLHDDLDLLFKSCHLYALTTPSNQDEMKAEILADTAIQFEHTFGQMTVGRRMELVLLLMTRYADYIRANDAADEVHKLGSSMQVGNS